MDHYRQATELPWRNPITGPYKSNTSIKVSIIAGAITLACLGIGLVIGVMLLTW